MKRIVIMAAGVLTAWSAWARGGGGCFEEGTPILTPSGERAIETLRVGDEVIGGTVQAITRVEPAEYLELPDGIHVTAEHPFQISPGVFREAGRVFPEARRLTATHPAYNLLVSPGGRYIAKRYIVHNKGCFLPDTPILRADGSEVWIRDVKPGDELLAFTTAGDVVHARVRRVITHEVSEYLVVTTGKSVLRVTVEHPFYVGDGTLKTLEALHVGDSVYAYDGAGLSAQPIESIERVRQPTRVYNLQTDAPNTYFANRIAVHNKGGGGGGGGGGGFHGGGYHRSSGRGGSGDPRVFFFVVGAVIMVIIISKVMQAKQEADENLDDSYSRGDIEPKAVKTRKLLEFIAKVDDEWTETKLAQRATETFVKLQECWQAREYGPMEALMMPDLYAEHGGQIRGMIRNHEINMIAGLGVEHVDIVNLRYTHKESDREFTALITAQATDYYVDDRTQEFLRGDESPARFQEFWTFQWMDGAWRLREVEQTRESDALKGENFFEQFTDKGVEQVYGEAAGQIGPAGPWLPAGVETKATRTERMLNFLAQTDRLWDRQAMLERARQIFTQVMLSQEAGDPSGVPDALMIPETASNLRDLLTRRHAEGVTVEYRNLCVRKVELILVRNFGDNTKDEFVTRISAHAQKIVKRAGEVVHQDEYVSPFVEYWTFGRLDKEWKLKEVLPPGEGEADVGAENVDEDSNSEQLQWYYRQTRAN